MPVLDPKAQHTTASPLAKNTDDHAAQKTSPPSGTCVMEEEHRPATAPSDDHKHDDGGECEWGGDHAGECEHHCCEQQQLAIPHPRHTTTRVLDTKLAVSVRRTTRSGRRADYIDAVRSHSARLSRIPLAVHCDVDTAQAFRDASREEIMLNGVCFVGDHRTEAFVAAVKRIVSRHVEQPATYLDVTDRIMRGCSRTLSGSDSYFALHELFASPDILIKPRQAKPIPLSVTLGLDCSGALCVCVPLTVHVRPSLVPNNPQSTDVCYHVVTATSTIHSFQTTASAVASSPRTSTDSTGTTTSTRCFYRKGARSSRSSRSTRWSSSRWT